MDIREKAKRVADDDCPYCEGTGFMPLANGTDDFDDTFCECLPYDGKFDETDDQD